MSIEAGCRGHFTFRTFQLLIFSQDFPGEELLVVFDKDLKYGQAFYLIATEEGKEKYFHVRHFYIILPMSDRYKMLDVLGAILTQPCRSEIRAMHLVGNKLCLTLSMHLWLPSNCRMQHMPLWHSCVKAAKMVKIAHLDITPLVLSKQCHGFKCLKLRWTTF